MTESVHEIYEMCMRTFAMPSPSGSDRKLSGLHSSLNATTHASACTPALQREKR